MYEGSNRQMGQYIVSGVALAILGLAFMKLLFMRERAGTTSAPDQPGEEDSQGPLESLFEEAPVAIVVLDLKANVWKWNRAAEQMFGWARQEVLGRSTPIMSSDADRALHVRVLGGETVRGMELARQGKDGKPVEIKLTATALRDARGGVTGVLEWMVDMTGEKRTQQDLQRVQHMAILGWLAAGIVHDFNNLVMVVASHNAKILEGLDQRSPLRAPAVEIDRACQRADGLARQLLAFSRGRAALPTAVDLNAVVREVQGMLERLTRKNIKWVLRLDPLKPVVEADSGQIHQALVNLVLNAFEAMPDGGVLTIQTVSVDTGGNAPAGNPKAAAAGYTLLAISDTGVGFDETVKNRLFEPFFTTKENRPARGFGLATVHRTVTEAGGWIQVHSQPEEGTRFEIYLPQMTAHS
jgi:two-component system cell cycle sensor histidine kinase/response regulator CckA